MSQPFVTAMYRLLKASSRLASPVSARLRNCASAPSARSACRLRAGAILHPTSLPGPYGTGELGEHAYAFVDWLRSAGLQAWQARLPPSDRASHAARAGRPPADSGRMARRAAADGASTRRRQCCDPNSNPMPQPQSRAAQALPLVPPEAAVWSPYTGLDTLCGNMLLMKP